jgi:hypothetical protein
MDTPLTAAQVATAEQRASKEGYIHSVLVAFDDFWNVAGSPVFYQQKGLVDETISAHTRRIVDDPTAKHKLLAKVLNHLLDVIQPDHGAKAEAGDAERAQAVAAVENKQLGV